jgi:hypothetical protein
VSNTSVCLQDLEPFAHWCEDLNYARNLIHETEHYSLILLAWNPFSSSAIHTHSNSQCWAKVYYNEVNEYVYDNLENRKVTKCSTAQEGAVLYIDDVSERTLTPRKGKKRNINLK